MKLTPSTLSLALLAALVAPAAHAEITIDVIGNSEVSFEGLVQADGNWFDNDLVDLNAGSVGPNGGNGKDSEFELRRAELVLKGKGPGNIEWVVGYDAKADKFLDTNVKYKIGGNSNHYFVVGQFKQPNSMEELSSTKNNDFISKALVTNTFGVARRLGAAYRYGDSNWGITASMFGRELTRNLAHGSGYGVRANWAPINEGGQIFHLGLSYVDFDTDFDSARLRARPDADLATERLVDTGNIVNADRQSTLGFETFYANGPMKLQAEYMQASIDRYSTGFASQPGNTFKGDSWYVSGVWNVTGEKFGYKEGTPTTPGPDNPASGMWQLGLRYDKIDLDDGSVTGNPPAAVPGDILGGDMNTITAGVNWYLRSNFKFMLNYVKVSSTKFKTVGGVPGFYDDDPNIIEARAQFFW